MNPLIAPDARDEHRANLERVSSKIGASIIDFCRGRSVFHADDLRRHVSHVCGAVAPASADRILRHLRIQGKINYRVISRSDSRYEVLPVVAPSPVELELPL